MNLSMGTTEVLRITEKTQVGTKTYELDAGDCILVLIEGEVVELSLIIANFFNVFQPTTLDG